MSFFEKPLSVLFSKAKEGAENSLILWFRKKYNLSPKDPRFLEVTYEEIQEEWLVEHLTENPNLTLEELTVTRTADNEWMNKIEQEELEAKLKEIFSKPSAGDFEVVERETR